MASSLRLPHGPLTVDDLDGFPDDGRRYELSHGTLIVTPAPQMPHQVAFTELLFVLRSACPDDLLVVPGTDVVISRDTVKVPDLVVVEASHHRDRKLYDPPLLVAEIHSPSTKVLDRTEKRVAYGEMGIPSYWLVDVEERALTVLELEGGAYAERAVARPGEPVSVERPYAVTLDPEVLFR